MQNKWRVSDEASKLLQTAERFTDVLKIVLKQIIIDSWPDPRDIDYTGVSDWTEGPLRQWLDKLAALALPTGQEEITLPFGSRVTATGNILDNRLVSTCNWEYSGRSSCEAVAYKG